MKKKKEFVSPRIRAMAKIDVEDVLDYVCNEDMYEDMYDYETSFVKTKNGYDIVSTKSLDIHDMRDVCENMFISFAWWEEAVDNAPYYINEESMTFHIGGDECVLEFTADLDDDECPLLPENVSLIREGSVDVGDWSIELIES